MSNTLAIQTNFEIAKEHNLLIEKRLDMLAKQEKEVSNPPKQSEPIVHPLATEDKGDFNTVLKHQSSSTSSSTGAQLKSTMEPINEEVSVSNSSDHVDPVTIVSIMENLDMSEFIHIILEGESLLNDGLSIFIFNIYMSFKINNNNSEFIFFENNSSGNIVWNLIPFAPLAAADSIIFFAMVISPL